MPAGILMHVGCIIMRQSRFNLRRRDFRVIGRVNKLRFNARRTDFFMVSHTLAKRVANQHVAHHALCAFDGKLTLKMRHHAARFFALSAETFAARNNGRHADKPRQQFADNRQPCRD